MPSVRTAWHVLFYALLDERKPEAFMLAHEIALSAEPLRLDVVLLRKRAAEPTGPAGVLRALWAHLPHETVGEFKSASRPLRPRDLDRLLGVTHLHFAQSREPLPSPEVLAFALFVVRRTPTLREELVAQGLREVPLAPGYARLEGGRFGGFLVVLAEAAEAEHDAVLAVFNGAEASTAEAFGWLRGHLFGRIAGMAIEQSEEYDVVVTQFVNQLTLEQRLAGLAPEQRLAGLAPEQRLAGLAPEQRLAGLAPEQRLAGLTPEQTVLALATPLLRALDPAYVATLPPAVQAEVRRRLSVEE